MKMRRWLQQPQEVKQAKAMDDITAVLKRFGDEQSTLLDKFERLSFEVQLNQAMLGRSLSDPSLARPAHHAPPRVERSSALGAVAAERLGGGRATSFRRVFKKLFRTILGKKSSGSNNADAAAAAEVEADYRIPNYQYSKAFSRSLRV